jgi:hypothetical protein
LARNPVDQAVRLAGQGFSLSSEYLPQAGERSRFFLPLRPSRHLAAAVSIWLQPIFFLPSTQSARCSGKSLRCVGVK